MIFLDPTSDTSNKKNLDLFGIHKNNRLRLPRIGSFQLFRKIAARKKKLWNSEVSKEDGFPFRK